MRDQLNEHLIQPLKDLIKYKDIAPDYLVISGDLVEHPFPGPMIRAYNYICDLAEEAGIPPERTIIIPGNHDYKFFGNIGLGPLTRIPFEIYFGSQWNDRGDWKQHRNWIRTAKSERAGDYAAMILRALWPWSKRLADRPSMIVDEERGVVIFGVNSTPMFQWFGFATGRVSGNQVFELTSALRNNQDKWEGFFKAVVVHHHPLPISYDHSSTSKRIEESLMVFYNAGGFLRELAREGVDLILHGHKHFSSFARAVYDFEGGMRRSIGVLAAGSATHRKPDDPMGNEFNLISIFDDDTVTIDRWYYAPDQRRKDESPKYFLYDLDDIKRHRRKRDERIAGMTIGQVNKTVNLTHDGFSRIELYLQDCRAFRPDGLSEYVLDDVEAQRPTYIRGLEVIRKGTTFKFPSVELFEDSHLHYMKGRLRFNDVRLPNDPFDLAYGYRLMNGHALSLRQFRRKYAGKKYEGNDLTGEYSSIRCDRSTEFISLTVEFPKGFETDRISDYDAVALYSPHQNSNRVDVIQHESETARIKGKIKMRRRRLTLDVVSPVPGFTYRIRWSYKRDTIPQPGVLHQSAVQSIQARLIEIAQSVDERTDSRAAYGCVSELLNKFLKGVQDGYPGAKANEQLHISLAVFDREISALRFVACNFNEISNLVNDTFMPGEGCEGFAFEKSALAFYDRSEDKDGYYILPHELRAGEGEGGQTSALEEYEYLISIPWIHESGLVVGVVNVSSKSKYSLLLTLIGLDSKQKKESGSVLLVLTQALGEAIIGQLSPNLQA